MGDDQVRPHFVKNFAQSTVHLRCVVYGIVGEGEDAYVGDAEKAAHPFHFPLLELCLLGAWPLQDFGAPLVLRLAHFVFEFLVVGGDAVGQRHHGDAIPPFDVVGGGSQGVGNIVRVGGNGQQAEVLRQLQFAHSGMLRLGGKRIVAGLFVPHWRNDIQANNLLLHESGRRPKRRRLYSSSICAYTAFSCSTENRIFALGRQETCTLRQRPAPRGFSART